MQRLLTSHFPLLALDILNIHFKKEIMSDSTLTQSIEEKVIELLDRIRPNIQMDGGDVEFVSYEDGVVKVQLHGACVGCHLAQVTLYMGIQEMLQRELPEVKQVIAV